MSHHRHSGRKLPHSHTSYPALAMMLLLVGVLLVNTSRAVSAVAPTGSGSYQVTAAYLGPPPASAATIDSPVDGTRFKNTPITVTGTCPADTYVMLTRNGVSSGTAICGPLNTYSLQTDLFDGSNALLAHVFSKFDVAGPNSNGVTVTYDKSVPVTPTPTSTTPSTAGSPVVQTRPDASLILPLLLKSNFKYSGHNLGQSVNYQFEIIGGQAPYAVSINWGDGTTKTVSIAASGPFSVSHTYEKASQSSNSFKIIASAVDVAGEQTILQLLAIANDQPRAPLVTKSPSGDLPAAGFGEQLKNAFRYIWPTYGIVTLMLASFWFGELRELKLLRPKSGQHRHA